MCVANIFFLKVLNYNYNDAKYYINLYTEVEAILKTKLIKFETMYLRIIM